MITKERLEELIEQGATIYRTYANCDVLEYKLDKTYIKVDNAFLWKKLNGAIKSVMYPLDQLFENREEAEWHKEFGCIERTERLHLPTWEENLSINCIFNTPNNNLYSLKTRIKTGYSIEKDNPYIIRLEKLRAYDTFIDYEFTKENYTLACRKAKELFLGENK